jgi:hypothetical protein
VFPLVRAPHVDKAVASGMGLRPQRGPAATIR